MSIQKLRKSVNYLVLATGLITATAVSACSAEPVPVDTASSIEKNDTSKLYQLGLNYYKGSSVKQDYEKAFNLFQEAASQGDAKSQFQLGEPPRDCRRLNILREYDNEKTNLHS